ncbi:hypothetical protein AA313_de0201088 [Arthrobotrys entomopaga]|nr:hypothetical protein AA313_de0201088 [Arthrobotrys entomopaga]
MLLDGVKAGASGRNKAAADAPSLLLPESPLELELEALTSISFPSLSFITLPGPFDGIPCRPICCCFFCPLPSKSSTLTLNFRPRTVNMAVLQLANPDFPFPSSPLTTIVNHSFFKKSTTRFSAVPHSVSNPSHVLKLTIPSNTALTVRLVNGGLSKRMPTPSCRSSPGNPFPLIVMDVLDVVTIMSISTTRGFSNDPASILRCKSAQSSASSNPYAIRCTQCSIAGPSNFSIHRFAFPELEALIEFRTLVNSINVNHESNGLFSPSAIPSLPLLFNPFPLTSEMSLPPCNPLNVSNRSSKTSSGNTITGRFHIVSTFFAKCAFKSSTNPSGKPNPPLS